MAPMRPSIMSDGATMSTPARHDIRPAHQHGDRFVIENIAGVVDQAVLSVARVRIERDVGDHAEFREALLEGCDRLRREAVGIERLLGTEALPARVDDREIAPLPARPVRGSAPRRASADRS
jgi:hypothetical protein